jgi:thioredoxin reductase (NADPH)
MVTHNQIELRQTQLMTNIEKVVIIGSGPAGHTAAIYSARANLQPLMFEGFMAGGVSAGGALTMTHSLENFPGHIEIGGIEFTEKLREQSIHYGTRIVTETIAKVDLSQRPFKLWTEADVEKINPTVLTQTLIIATGASAKRLNIPGGEKYWNNGISACAVCDGSLPLFKNKPVCVVGGGDTAVEEALYMTKFASEVYLIHRRDKLRASQVMIQRLKKNPKIKIVWNSVVEGAAASGQNQKKLGMIKIKNVVTQKNYKLNVSGMFYAIGHTPQTELFRNQLDMDDDGYLITHETITNIEGVFAAGDCQDKKYRQAITAAGTGCMAALNAERYLNENE